MRITAAKYLFLICHLVFLQYSFANEIPRQEFLIKLPQSTTLYKPANAVFDNLTGIADNYSEIVPVTKDRSHALSDWYLVSLPASAKQDLISLQNGGQIAAWQENHVFKISNDVPDDSLYQQQWYHRKVAAASAWPWFVPQSDIILAIIDTGVDYLHPDLANSLWINESEDLNGNGRLDQGDINNLDDDGNGYIDDVIGWDFTHAPAYRDEGDYLDPDNDPMDEYFSGHGTQIAGIIGAGINNQTGIAGLLPGVRLMNLRAGTSSGYLEEDDVARAVIYAIENGARVINMSFGDIVVSPFLEDVVRYAWQKNTVIVAAAGNNGSDQIHYPAGFAETISVGATDQNDGLAGFSTWGATMDLVAPGKDILSTARGGGYNSVNGTSFSAPIVAAGAALILAENPELTPEQVRNILRTTSDDLGAPGWDTRFGAGRINFEMLAKNEMQRSLFIHHPDLGSSMDDDPVTVIVTVLDPDLKAVSLNYGLGLDPQDWIPIRLDYTYQMIQDTLAVFETNTLPDTTLTIQLLARSLNGEEYEYRSVFDLDRQWPATAEVRTVSLLNENRSAVLIEFTTSEKTTAKIYYRSAGSSLPFTTQNLSYETANHRWLLDARQITGDVEYYISVRDRAGHETVDDNNGIYYQTAINGSYIDDQPLIQATGTLPAGYALNEATDLDQDGKYEIVISKYDDKNNFGPLQVYEYEDGGFNLIYESGFPALPRAWGDPDGDGKKELLTGYGNVSRLLEVSATDPLQMEIVYQDTGLWAATIADTDDDGHSEILFRRDKSYEIHENSGDNQYSLTAVLPNPSAGANSPGPPVVVISDLDSDGHQEIIFGDYDGDVVIYENSGDNSVQWRHTERLPFRDATGYLLAERFFGQDGTQLVAGCYTGGDVNYEHEFDARYWRYTIIEASGNNTYKTGQEISLYGYSDLRDFDSGIGSGALNASGENWLVLAPFPNIYLFKTNDDVLKPVWHADDARTNTIIIHDFDGNGAKEFYYNNGSNFSGYALTTGNRPVPPGGFTAYPLDSATVKLEWSAASAADYFRIYRGSTDSTLMLIDSVNMVYNYVDTNLIGDTSYFYGLQAIDGSFTDPVSQLSNVRVARPNQPPRLDSLVIISADQIQLFFSEKMHDQTFLANHYSIGSGDQPARSALAAGNGKSCIITFDMPLTSGVIHTLIMTDVIDLDRTPLHKNYRRVDFYYEEFGDKPYITEWYFIETHVLNIQFNMPMDTVSVLNSANYTVRPAGKVNAIRSLDSEGKKFSLSLSPDTYTGATGVTSYLECRNLKNINGRQFTEGRVINLVRVPETAEDVFVYPQPARLDLDWIGFANVSADTRIDIFDLSGRRVKLISDQAQNGGVRWDLTNDRGEKIAAGIYIYQVRSGNITKTGKFTVVR